MRLHAPIPYADLSTAELLACYNTLAKTRGRERLKSWKESRMLLVQKLAILRTLPVVIKKPKRPPAPAPMLTGRDLQRRKYKRASPVRDATVKALCAISHYVDFAGRRVSKAQAKREPSRVRSVGYTYPQCVAMVKASLPSCRVSASDMRWTVQRIRKKVAGYEGALPYHRPRKEGLPK